jgi:Uma2 family endonuclease
MAVQTKTYIAPEEYLEIERKTETKSEYYNGEMFAMGGATEQHVTIVSNIVYELSRQLRNRECKVYATDLKLHIIARRMYFYPDVMVACREMKFLGDRREILVNPSVIMEVLSESTQAYDRGLKFDQYRSIESLKEYLLVDQTKPHIEQYVRQPDNKWLLTVFNGMDKAVDLPSIVCRLPLVEVYHKVEFDRTEEDG